MIHPEVGGNETMPLDANGTEIQIGDVITCRFVVRSFIADSQTVNLLCGHFKGHAGIPDDWRLPLESTQVDIYQSAEVEGEAAADVPEHKRAAGAGKHAKADDGEPEAKHGHEPAAGDKKHAKEHDEPERKHGHEHEAAGKKHAKD
jgi:hypothetical protein